MYIQKLDDKLILNQQVHLEDHQEDCKLPPNRVDVFCKNSLKLSKVYQIKVLDTNVVTNDNRHIASMVGYTFAQGLEDHLVHDIVSGAVLCHKYLVSGHS